MPRARGTKKNLLLTLWLILPFLVVGGLVAGIFITYAKGPTMDARPVGQGAGDTGGANAIGELLAGNDPDQRARTNRDLREGRLLDPLDWPAGIRLMVTPRDTSVGIHTVWLWGGEGGPEPESAITTGFVDQIGTDKVTRKVHGGSAASLTISRDRLRGLFADGRTGAGLYISESRQVTVCGDRLCDTSGTPLDRITIGPVERANAIEGEPIVIRIVLGDD